MSDKHTLENHTSEVERIKALEADLEEIRDQQVVGETYFHINNGGVTIAVLNGDQGPVLDIQASHFGMQTNHMKLDITEYGLKKLQGMLDEALKYKFNSVDRHWPKAQTLEEQDLTLDEQGGGEIDLKSAEN